MLAVGEDIFPLFLQIFFATTTAVQLHNTRPSVKETSFYHHTSQFRENKCMTYVFIPGWYQAIGPIVPIFPSICVVTVFSFIYFLSLLSVLQDPCHLLLLYKTYWLHHKSRLWQVSALQLYYACNMMPVVHVCIDSVWNKHITTTTGGWRIAAVNIGFFRQLCTFAFTSPVYFK